MKKTALILILITIISKVLGFGRDIVLSYYYGTSNISDAYIIALSIPLVIFAFIGKGISSSYIPMYNKIEKQEGLKKAELYTNNIINILFVLCTFLSVISLIFTEQLVKLFAAGFNQDTIDIAVMFTRYGLIGLNITMLISIYSALLQIKGNYIIPALIGFPMNFCIIITIIISSNGNIYILGIGLFLSVIAQFLFMLPFLLKEKIKYNLKLNIKDPNVRNMIVLSIPIIIGVAVNDINKIVDRTLASQISEGAISALNYANRLSSFVHGTIVLSIATVIFPTMSKMAAENKIQLMKKTMSEAIISISLLIVPTTIVVLFFAQPIVELIFGRGAFDRQAVEMTSNALIFYSIGMFGIGMREILTRPFYALQDTKTPMINATIGVVLNIILNIVLSRYLGIGGLALATSLSATITMILMFISLRKKIGPLGISTMFSSLIKITLASVVMGVLMNLLFYYLPINNQNPLLFIVFIAGIIMYCVMISLFRINEVDIFIKNIKAKMKVGNR
ncbi:putative peptidoglycan lipid II flippase [Psychrobacillus psychrotolerans]|uniref:Probable lipid II flippase MurJ n=1 Tax=Psychrobacillus psychrotolerans TaxID=126156 RepID=A0A1I5Z5B1_9BACI|nr:murein biosynthesis integral membrane protein MurJ [Psychrobacillus psychrotolerans]SFQ51652.1 putative peptidoglycan lipid II flippase [Psychrobacillus psychrotolerans]